MTALGFWLGSPAAGSITALALLFGSFADVTASLVPSSELSFRISLAPDSITVGDPIRLTMSAAGPEKAVLLLPELVDSIGPFSVLEATALKQRVREGRVELTREAQVTLFRTGSDTLPALPLLWVRAPGETLVAYSQESIVRVRSLLGGEADLSDLRDLKAVVPLSGPRFWLWALGAVLLFILAALLWRYRKRARATVPFLTKASPPLPPEVAFERGLEALWAEKLLERGLVKAFYFELSMLLRKYIEGRFGIPAVEETRTELVEAIERRRDLPAEDQAWLSAWLAEGDLVKFAKMERLLAEAKTFADSALAWVRRTSRLSPVPASSTAPAALSFADPRALPVSGAATLPATLPQTLPEAGAMETARSKVARESGPAGEEPRS